MYEVDWVMVFVFGAFVLGGCSGYVIAWAIHAPLPGGRHTKEKLMKRRENERRERAARGHQAVHDLGTVETGPTATIPDSQPLLGRQYLNGPYGPRRDG